MHTLAILVTTQHGQDTQVENLASEVFIVFLHKPGTLEQLSPLTELVLSAVKHVRAFLRKGIFTDSTLAVNQYRSSVAMNKPAPFEHLFENLADQYLMSSQLAVENRVVPGELL